MRESTSLLWRQWCNGFVNGVDQGSYWNCKWRSVSTSCAVATRLITEMVTQVIYRYGTFCTGDEEEDHVGGDGDACEGGSGGASEFDDQDVAVTMQSARRWYQNYLWWW